MMGMSKVNDSINKFISVVEGFQYSVNIGYDLASDEKIRNFYPTSRAIELIEDVMLSTAPSSTDRARLIVGAYGKGKSHLMLVLLSLLHRKDESLFTSLLNKIMDTNRALYEYVLDYLHSDKKLLPVVIQGNSINLNQSFLGAMRKALAAENLAPIMPDTYFKSVIEIIDTWKKDYPKTYVQFVEGIKEPVSGFMEQLRDYNQDCFERFIQLYPKLTSGSEFNPVEGLDVVELYENVVRKIKPKGYSGIFVVYDEFSKFLEGSIEKTSAMEIKLLQDFAEKCNRSRDNQLHIFLISHKHIINYVDQLPKQKTDAWRAVSERFKTVEVQNQSSQVYEVISQVVKHDIKGFEPFARRQMVRFDAMYSWIKSIPTFAELTDDELRNVVQACYPLHPITTFLLPRISEKVAQNERTIFTFLSANQHNTLWAFLKNAQGEFPLLTPDYVFEYFESLFKQEGYQTEIYKTWRMAAATLEKIPESNLFEKQIVKTIALIYILGMFEKLPPTPKILIDIYKDIVPEMSMVVAALNSLQDKRFLYLMKSKQYLRLMESSDVDIGRLISDTVAKRRTVFDVLSTLNQHIHDRYLYPTGYNDDHEITRYFDFEFVGLQTLLSVRDWDKKLTDRTSVGVVFAISLNQSEDMETVISIVQTIKHERVFFIVPRQLHDIEGTLRKFDAIEALLLQHADDTLLCEELTVYHNDLAEVVRSYIDAYIRPELRMSSYYHQGLEKVIYRKSQITQMLSAICNDVYSLTPIINNEVINKDVPTTVVINSRRKVLTGLLMNELKPDLGLEGYGQDVSIMRSTLKNTGILVSSEDDERSSFQVNWLEPKIQNTIDTIKSFFLKTSNVGKRSFKDLYDILTRPEYHIGLKKGVIPIFVAVVLHTMKNHVVIVRGGREMEINARLLDSINAKPEEYEAFLEDWNEQKEAYIKGLEVIFAQSIRESEKNYNSFDYIVKSMQRWFIQLPKYAKEADRIYQSDGRHIIISNSTKQLRSGLKGSEINAHEFLFVRLPKVFGCLKLNHELLKQIEDSKNILDGAKRCLIEVLTHEVIQLFSRHQSPKATFRSVMMDWYDRLSSRIKNHIFASGEERIITLIRDMTNDHSWFIKSLARNLTGLRIDDWEDDTIEAFSVALKRFKDSVEQQNEARDLHKCGLSGGSYYLSLVDDMGNKVIRTFDKTPYSERAKLFYNEVTNNIEEYGEAVSKQELRQVLLDIVDVLCKE
jgi:hypothetical protein